MTDETVTITRATYEKLCRDSFLHWHLRWRCIVTGKEDWVDDAETALGKVEMKNDD